MIHHRSLDVLAAPQALHAQRVRLQIPLGRFAPRVGVPSLSRTSRRLRVQWPMDITVLCPRRNQLRTAWVTAGNLGFTRHTHTSVYSIGHHPRFRARRWGKEDDQKTPSPGLRRSAKGEKPNAQGIRGAGGQVHPAGVWRSLSPACVRGSCVSAPHPPMKGDRFTPRVQLYRRPRKDVGRSAWLISHDTVLPQTFGSWTPSFLLDPSFLRPDRQIAH